MSSQPSNIALLTDALGLRLRRTHRAAKRERLGGRNFRQTQIPDASQPSSGVLIELWEERDIFHLATFTFPRSRSRSEHSTKAIRILLTTDKRGAATKADRLLKGGAVVQPTLFIGSSSERLPIARGLKQILTDCADVTVWNEAPEFGVGESILNSLIKVGEVYDFALLVFGQDDSTMMGGVELPTVRDNVLFELGLFMGHMGTGRAFWLSPKGSKAPHLPSDLGGIIHLAFDEPEMTNATSISESLAETRDKVYRQISSLGFRTNRTSHVVPMRQALCLASSQYSQARFQRDLEYIHAFFSEREVTSEQGVTADHFQDYFGPKCRWDIVHLGLFVDKENERMLFDTPSGTGDIESLRIQAIEGMIKDCGAALVVIITCDSLKFGEQLARFTNVIAGHQAITPSGALSWAKVFYQALSVGMPLSQAFDKAQDAADPGLVLLARRDIRFRRQART